jgi:hypothetical protein
MPMLGVHKALQPTAEAAVEFSVTTYQVTILYLMEVVAFRVLALNDFCPDTA